jgi:hypothetical protein
MNTITFNLPDDQYDAVKLLCEMRDALDDRAIKLRKRVAQQPCPTADKLEAAAHEVHASVLRILSHMARNVIKGEQNV